MTKGIATKVMKPLTIGTRLVCDDNSGAKVVEIIGVVGIKGKKRRYPVLGIGDVAIVAVKKGTPQMIKKVERALIIRQKSPIRRPNGLRVAFEDNACALVDETGLPKGTEIKGVVAREIAENFSKVAAIAWSIV
ncbi:MAG: uL14 family ribosomal protein [Candidatus Micrarchaeia archaeon]